MSSQVSNTNKSLTLEFSQLVTEIISENGRTRPIILQITNHSEASIELYSNHEGNAGDGNYTFALEFPSGILSQLSNIVLTDWKIRLADGVIYLLSLKPISIDAGSSLEPELNIGALIVKPDSTTAQVTFHHMRADQTAAYTQAIFATYYQPYNLPKLDLQPSVLGTLLNNTDTYNTVGIFLTNTSRNIIKIDENTEFSIEIPKGTLYSLTDQKDNEPNVGLMINLTPQFISLSKRFKLKNSNSTEGKFNFYWDGDEVLEFKPNLSLFFTISNIRTGSYPKEGFVFIRYENITGFQDGMITVPIQIGNIQNHFGNVLIDTPDFKVQSKDTKLTINNAQIKLEGKTFLGNEESSITITNKKEIGEREEILYFSQVAFNTGSKITSSTWDGHPHLRIDGGQYMDLKAASHINMDTNRLIVRNPSFNLTGGGNTTSMGFYLRGSQIRFREEELELKGLRLQIEGKEEVEIEVDESSIKINNDKILLDSDEIELPHGIKLIPTKASGRPYLKIDSGSYMDLTASGHINIKTKTLIARQPSLSITGDGSNESIQIKVGASSSKVSKNSISLNTPSVNLNISNIRVNGSTPFVLKQYSVNINQNKRTGYRKSEWMAIVAGWNMHRVDVDESGRHDFSVRMYRGDTYWWIDLDFPYDSKEDDGIFVNVLFIRKELFS